MHIYSYDRGTTYNVYVDRKQLIAGMDKALLGMCVNERRLVKVPPQLAYGKDGYGNFIYFLISVVCFFKNIYVLKYILASITTYLEPVLCVCWEGDVQRGKVFM